MENFPRCATCKHFQAESSWGYMYPDGRYVRQVLSGPCQLIVVDSGGKAHISAGDHCLGDASLDVHDDFGCVLHEANA